MERKGPSAQKRNLLPTPAFLASHCAGCRAKPPCTLSSSTFNNIGEILQDRSQLWDFEMCWQEDSAGILPSSSSLPSRTESFAAKWVGRVQKSLSPNSLPGQYRGQPHVHWGCQHLNYFLETIPSEGSSPSDKAL